MPLPGISEMDTKCKYTLDIYNEQGSTLLAEIKGRRALQPLFYHALLRFICYGGHGKSIEREKQLILFRPIAYLQEMEVACS